MLKIIQNIIKNKEIKFKMQCHQFFGIITGKKEVMMMIREEDADKLHDRMRRLDSLFCLGQH